MKTIVRLLTIGIIMISASLAKAADTYYVIHLKGSVSNKTTGKEVKVGDKISSEDQLKFASKDSEVVIMGAKGKFTLSPALKANYNSSNELVAYVNSALLPLKSNGHLSTRGTGSAAVTDLKTYFGPSRFIIVGNRLEIALDPTLYPINNEQIFVYRYMYRKGLRDTAVSKKIESQGNKIILDKTALYTVNGTVIDPSTVSDVEIYHFNTQSKKSVKAASFSPFFLNEETLKTELQVQRNYLKDQNQPESQIAKELISFVYDVYGKTDEDVLSNWISTNVSGN